MWALVIDSVIRDFTLRDPAGVYHGSMTWLQVPPEMRPFVTLAYTVTSDGISPPSLASFRGQLAQAVADRRWQEESKGALHDGRRFATDDRSQGKMLASVVLGEKIEAVNAVGSYQVSWKSMDGFVTLGLVQLTNAAVACGMHVQQAFAREAQITALIEAAPDWQSALQAYTANINTGWPA